MQLGLHLQQLVAFALHHLADWNAGRPRNHFGNFLDCIRSRQQTVSHFEAALRSDTISHLSEIVIRTKSPLKWDPKTEKIVDGKPEQTALLDRPMRDGFTI